jgi:2-hydroxy-3-oxopropionate reductase
LIGLGVMGKPMARHVLAAGHTLTAFDVDGAALAEAVAGGAEAASSPAAVAAASELTITMLPGPSVVEDVVLGAGGVLSGAQPGSLLVDMSTVDPALARRLAVAGAERDVATLDAPVSGGEVGAREGSLSIMVGGEASDVERARPVLECLGTTIVHVGPHGAGQIVKACNQVVVGITYAAVSEALVLGSKSGVDPALIIDVLSGGLAANRIMEVKRDSFLEHDFRPAGPVDMTYKDLKIALASADEVGAPLPLTALVQQMLGSLRANGHGQLDHSALLTVYESWAGHRIGEAP